MNANDISKNNRQRKYKLFIEKINPSEKDLILDIGFANLEYSPVDNYLEKNYPYPSNITALGVVEADIFKKNYPLVKVVIYDGSKFPFDDNSFDIAWSNAVIEHVGNEEKQVFFLKELARTCKKFYITTPNRLFPFELHTRLPFLHWLPKKIFDKILVSTSKKWAAGDYMHLLTYRKIKTLLRKAGINDYEIHRNRLFGFTIDFSIIILKK